LKYANNAGLTLGRQLARRSLARSPGSKNAGEFIKRQAALKASPPIQR